MFNLHKLDVFLRVAEMGSFSGAAESLLMTQSAVSHHIRDLERHLGSQLFERNQRGVTLTESGKKLRHYGLQIADLIATAEQEITDLSQIESGEVYVGSTPGIGATLLPDCIVLFRQKFPKLSVVMQTGTSATIIELLQAGKIEIGIIEGEIEEGAHKSIHVQLLHDIQQKVIIGPNHPWWGRGMISFHELDGQEFVMRQPNSQTRIWLDDVLLQNNIYPKVSTVFDNIDSMKRSVIRGGCLAVMPEYTVQDELAQGIVQALSIEEESLKRTLKIIQKSGKRNSPTASAFLRHLEECLHNSKGL